MRKSWFYILSILLVLLVTGCSQVETAQPGRPDGQATRQVVRILNLNVDLQQRPAAPATQPPATLKPSPSASPTTPDQAALVTATVTEAGAPLTVSEPSQPACSNKAELIKDLSIAPNTMLKPEIFFMKSWQVKNTGTCTWTTGYALVFASGEQLSGLATNPLPHAVAPGETIDLGILLATPADLAQYNSNWMLRDEAGNLFGLGDQADQPLIVSIIISTEGGPANDIPDDCG